MHPRSYSDPARFRTSILTIDKSGTAGGGVYSQSNGRLNGGKGGRQSNGAPGHGTSDAGVVNRSISLDSEKRGR